MLFIPCYVYHFNGSVYHSVKCVFLPLETMQLVKPTLLSLVAAPSREPLLSNAEVTFSKDVSGRVQDHVAQGSSVQNVPT